MVYVPSLFIHLLCTKLTPSPADYGLEALPIFLCAVLFLISNPGRLVPQDRSLRLHPQEFASEDGSQEKTSARAGRTWYGRKRVV